MARHFKTTATRDAETMSDEQALAEMEARADLGWRPPTRNPEIAKIIRSVMGDMHWGGQEDQEYVAEHIARGGDLGGEKGIHFLQEFYWRQYRPWERISRKKCPAAENMAQAGGVRVWYDTKDLGQVLKQAMTVLGWNGKTWYVSKTKVYASLDTDANRR